MSKFRFWKILSAFFVATGLFQGHGMGQPEKQRSAAYYYRTGEVHLEKHRWTDALHAFDQCLRQDPAYADAYYSRAIVLERFDSLNRALTDYNIYLEFRPEHHEALFARAQLRLRLGQYRLAQSDLQRLLRLPPGATTTVTFRTNTYTGTADQVFTARSTSQSYILGALGEVALAMHLPDSAAYYFGEALKLAPDDPDLLLNRGLARLQSADTLRAVGDFRAALTINPQHALAKHNLGALRKSAGIDEKRMLDEAIEDNPKLPFALAERAWQRYQSKDFVGANADYTRAIALEPSQPEYLMNRGLVREKLNDPSGAFTDYTAALKLRNDFDKAWLNRGNLLARLGKLQEAIADYNVAIANRPDYAAAFFNRAMAYHRLKQKDLACQDLKTAEKLGISIESKMWKSICGL